MAALTSARGHPCRPRAVSGCRGLVQAARAEHTGTDRGALRALRARPGRRRIGPDLAGMEEEPRPSLPQPMPHQAPRPSAPCDLGTVAHLDIPSAVDLTDQVLRHAGGE